MVYFLIVTSDPYRHQKKKEKNINMCAYQILHEPLVHLARIRRICPQGIFCLNLPAGGQSNYL